MKMISFSIKLKKAKWNDRIYVRSRECHDDTLNKSDNCYRFNYVLRILLINYVSDRF